MVHFAIVDEGPGVSPLCGSWGESHDWTLVRGAVSCPRCLWRLRAHDAAPSCLPHLELGPTARRLAPGAGAVRSPSGRTAS
jgi:hypothetical protein